MKSLIVLALFSLSLTASAQNVTKARNCWNEVAIQVSIGLSMEAHEARPGSQAERRAQREMRQFAEYVNDFPMFETGCHEGSANGKENACKYQVYVYEVSKLVREYGVNNIRSIPACRGIKYK